MGAWAESAAGRQGADVAARRGDRCLCWYGCCSYIPPGQTEDRKIPLEVQLVGDDAPLYGITSEDDGRGYAATVLPFQAYGTLGRCKGQ